MSNAQSFDERVKAFVWNWKIMSEMFEYEHGRCWKAQTCCRAEEFFDTEK